MSEDAIKNELAEDIATEEVVLSEEESSEEENVEEVNEETEELEEAKKVAAEEEEEEEEEVKEEAPTVTVPKTKAGVIQAAVDMLKKARKEDAQNSLQKCRRLTKLLKKNQLNLQTLQLKRSKKHQFLALRLK